MTDIQHLQSSHDCVVMTAEFPHTSPETLFEYWIDAQKIARWWPQQARINAVPGGQYHLYWPMMNWELYGTFGCIERGRVLEFSWHWKHEFQKPVRHVRVEFEESPTGGTHLLLTHGTYTPGDVEERQSHIDGWLYFLAQLQTVVA